MTKVNYKEIFAKNISTYPDTDRGVLKATWDTCKELIQLRDKESGLKHLAYMYERWGKFKDEEFKGDLIDAGIIDEN